MTTISKLHGDDEFVGEEEVRRVMLLTFRRYLKNMQRTRHFAAVLSQMEEQTSPREMHVNMLLPIVGSVARIVRAAR